MAVLAIGTDIVSTKIKRVILRRTYRTNEGVPRSAATHRRCTHCFMKCLGCGTDADTNTACTAAVGAVVGFADDDEEDEEEEARKASKEVALSRPLLQLLPPGGARVTAFPPWVEGLRRHAICDEHLKAFEDHAIENNVCKKIYRKNKCAHILLQYSNYSSQPPATRAGRRGWGSCAWPKCCAAIGRWALACPNTRPPRPRRWFSPYFYAQESECSKVARRKLL